MPRRRKNHKKMTIRSTDPVPVTARLSPGMLGAISITEPFRERMAQHVRDAYGMQDLSPTFINSVIASLPEYVPDDSPKSEVSHASKLFYRPTDSPEASPIEEFEVPHPDDEFFLPHVPEIEHFPGVSDHMHGALQADMRGPEEPYNDSLDCWNNRSSQFQHMPWRIIGVQELLEMPNLFHDPDMVQKCLPEEMFITNEGLRRAIEDLDIYFGQGLTHDEMLIIAIAKRAGRFVAKWNYRKKEWISVEYSENMIPFDLSGNGVYLDEEYWHELKTQGEEFWRENEPL